MRLETSNPILRVSRNAMSLKKTNKQKKRLLTKVQILFKPTNFMLVPITAFPA